MLPTTSSRVANHTASHVNREIRNQTDEDVARCASDGGTAMSARLQELDSEWDIERYLETMASTFTLVGLVLGLGVNKKWFLLPVAVQSFFLQHALQGWCPPIPVLRRLGIRTTREIERERHALKALRGDYAGITVQQRESSRRALGAAAR